MTEILTLIVEYASMWAPALVAVLGIVYTVLVALNKVKEAMKEFKADDTLKGLDSKLKAVLKENQELTRCNKILIDQITKINNYVDIMKGSHNDD